MFEASQKRKRYVLGLEVGLLIREQGSGAGPSAPPPPCDAKAARDFSSEAGLASGLTGLPQP